MAISDALGLLRQLHKVMHMSWTVRDQWPSGTKAVDKARYLMTSQIYGQVNQP